MVSMPEDNSNRPKKRLRLEDDITENEYPVIVDAETVQSMVDFLNEETAEKGQENERCSRPGSGEALNDCEFQRVGKTALDSSKIKVDSVMGRLKKGEMLPNNKIVDDEMAGSEDPDVLGTAKAEFPALLEQVEDTSTDIFDITSARPNTHICITVPRRLERSRKQCHHKAAAAQEEDFDDETIVVCLATPKLDVSTVEDEDTIIVDLSQPESEDIPRQVQRRVTEKDTVVQIRSSNAYNIEPDLNYSASDNKDDETIVVDASACKENETSKNPKTRARVVRRQFSRRAKKGNSFKLCN